MDVEMNEIKNESKKILENPVLRKSYFLCLKLIAQIVKFEANYEFIKDCIEKKTIPNTFKIKVYKKDKDSNLDQEWEKLASDSSVGFMSIACRQIEVNLEKLTGTIEEIRHGWKKHINRPKLCELILNIVIKFFEGPIDLH